jgi:hypothetical protein
MGTTDPDHQILLDAVRRIRKKIVAEIEEVTPSESGGDVLAAAVLASVVNVEAMDELARHSRILVRLTWVLILLTGVLGVLTAALLYRAFL